MVPFMECAPPKRPLSLPSQVQSPNPLICPEAVIWHFPGFKPWDVRCWLDAFRSGKDHRLNCKWAYHLMRMPHIEKCLFPKYAQLLALWMNILQDA